MAIKSCQQIADTAPETKLGPARGQSCALADKEALFCINNFVLLS